MTTTRQSPMPDNYDQAAVGHGSNRNFGMHILKPGVNGVVKKPSWNGTTTVFRPFPCLSYTPPHTDFEPFRVDPGGQNAFGPWIRKYDCAWNVGVGTGKITFLMSDPASRGPAYDPFKTPLGVLYSSIEHACKNKHPNTAEWQQLREGGQNRSKDLTPPSELYLCQGVIMVIDSKPQYGQGKIPIGWKGDGPTCFFAMSKGLGEKLVAECNKQVEGYKGDPGDFEARYVNGDVVSPMSGRFIYIFQKGHDPRNKFTSQPTQGSVQSWADVAGGGDAGAVGGGGGGGNSELKGFDLYLDKTLAGMSANFSQPHQMDKIRQKWCWWRDSLFFPTLPEQAKMLWDVFPKSACMYAWEKYHGWIDAEMRSQFANAVTIQTGLQAPIQQHQPHPDEWPISTFAPEPAQAFPPAQPTHQPTHQPVHQAPTAPPTFDAFAPDEAGGPSGFDEVLPATTNLAAGPAAHGFQPAAAGPDPFGAAAAGFDVAPAVPNDPAASAASLSKVALARARGRQAAAAGAAGTAPPAGNANPTGN